MTEKELLALALEEDHQQPVLTSLSDSLHPLRQHFNRYQDKLRFLALLSPTCGPCLEGALAIKEAILDPPNFDVAVNIVWIPMLTADSREHAQEAAKIIVDPRTRHFYDPQRFAGTAIAKVLGGNGKVAWDIYLFYPKKVEWDEAPPQPILWVHQLTGSLWADVDHYHTGPDLIAALSATARRILLHS